MLKTLLTVTRYCLKKTFVAAVTFAAKCAKGLVSMFGRCKDLLTEGCNWMGTALRKPGVTNNTEKKSSLTSMVMAGLKLALLQRFFMFLGGLVCCFVLPEETKGDLTWFERMLTSSRDFISNTAKAVLDGFSQRVTGLYSRKVGELS